MTVEYLRLTKFRGAYYLFSGLEKEYPQSITQVAVADCSACQHPYLVVQPLDYVSSLLDALREDMKNIAAIAGHPNQELSIYVCGQGSVFCANCGKEIQLPIPELLDADRTSFGRYALWMTTNHRRIR